MRSGIPHPVRRMNDLVGMVLMLGPALLGVTALVTGIVLLKRPPDAPANSSGRMVVGALSILLALGVGGCYAWVFLAGARW